MDTEPQNQANDEQTQAQTEEQRFTQEEVNRIVTDRVQRERQKFEKKYDGIDVDRYYELTEHEEQVRVDEQKKRGEFDQVLKDTVSKKDQVISSLQQELQAVKVDGALLNAASANKAVNPEQVVRLLKDQVRLVEGGAIEVVDPSNGQVRYAESGDPLEINGLVSEFLTANPHFLAATPKGSGTQSNRASSGKEKFDVSNLDMKNPADRQLYKEYQAERGLKNF